MSSGTCGRCGTRQSTVHICFVSCDGDSRRERLCKSCYALAYPVQAAADARFISEMRLEKLKRPMDFDLFRTRFLDRQSQYQPEHLTMLADQVAERLSVTKQSPPEDIQAFLTRYASSRAV